MYDKFSNVPKIDQYDISSVDYVIAIDETGTPTLKNITSTTPDHKAWFGVTGILIDKSIINESAKKITLLKEKYWSNGMFNSRRVVFHSRDIRKKTGAFNPKVIDYASFRDDLDNLISEIPIEIASSLINKKLHVQKYLNPFPTYSLALEFLLERICFKLEWLNSTGIILLESRGRREDFELFQQINYLLNNGNNFKNSDFFSRIKGIGFNKKRTSKGNKSYWPLEIADIISYRIFNEKNFNSSNNSDRFKAIEHKLINYPYYENEGIKIFP